MLIALGIARNVYFGSNGANNVYSFIPTGGATVTSFSGDLNVFLKVRPHHDLICVTNGDDVIICLST